MFTTLLWVKVALGAVAGAGGGYVAMKLLSKKKKTNTKVKKIERLEDRVAKRAEEDLTDIKRDLLVLKVKKHIQQEDFAKKLSQVHEIFEEHKYQHPQAHTFYNLLLPKLLKVKEAKQELLNVSDKAIDTDEMYASLNQWMDNVIAHKVDGLEGEAEINAKVITLLTK